MRVMAFLALPISAPATAPYHLIMVMKDDIAA